MTLADQILNGDRLALSRFLTRLENSEPESLELLAQLHVHTGGAHLIGVTGGPGTGKSTLVNKLVHHVRSTVNAGEAQQVAVVAVDPSSPFTGGAILGDRIRMQDLAGDKGVFIRSMASRGALGGLARSTYSLVQALDAAGFDLIFIETVGAGQAEVDIADAAHTTIVITAPGLGDEVQAIKAGILEIADILVVNKSDLPGADAAMSSLRLALQMGLPARQRIRSSRQIPESEVGAQDHTPWAPVVLPTVATDGEGIPELFDAVRKHQHFLTQSGERAIRERSRVRNHLQALLKERLLLAFEQSRSGESFEAIVDRVAARQIAPRQAIEELVDGGGH